MNNFLIYLFCNFDDVRFVVVDEGLFFLKVEHYISQIYFGGIKRKKYK